MPPGAAGAGAWGGLLGGLQHPRACGPLVCLGVAVLIYFRLMLFAAALPLMAYWLYSSEPGDAEGCAGEEGRATSEGESEGEGDGEGDSASDFEGLDPRRPPPPRKGADVASAIGADFDGASSWDADTKDTMASRARRIAPLQAPMQQSICMADSATNDVDFDFGLGLDDVLGLGDLNAASSQKAIDQSLRLPGGKGTSAPLPGGGEHSGGHGDDPFDFLGRAPSPGAGKGGGSGKGKGKGGKGRSPDAPGRDHLGSAGPRPPDPKQVFVGGVGDVPEAAIRSFFEEVGEVDRLKLLYQPDGQPKGVCFVTFRTEEQAQRALRRHGWDLAGATLRVRLAHGRGPGGAERAGAGALEHGPGGGPPRGRAGRGPSGGSEGGGGAEGAPEHRSEIDGILEEALEEEGGPLRPSDFDAGAKRFLTELMRRDRAQGTGRSVLALETIFRQVRNKQRESVRKWPAYVFTLLEKFDPQLCDELAARKASSGERQGGGHGARGEAPGESDIRRAWQYAPASSEGSRQVLDRWGKPVLL